jgi:UDP-N-acetylglucosamine transferase subunit ALG13
MSAVDSVTARRTGEDTSLALVLVGTDFHPFDRLVGWVDARASEGDGERLRWLVQHGASAPPRIADGRPFLPRDELERLLAESAFVVCHGGPGTIMEARRHGHVPIVVPRSAANGEHVDDHQRRFARRLVQAGHIRLAEDRQAFEAAIRTALAQPSRSTTRPRVEPDVERFRELADRLLAEPGGWRIGAFAVRASGRGERRRGHRAA